MRLISLTPLLALGLGARAQNVTETGVSPSFSPTPASTSVPEASGSPDEPVPGQGEYPTVQAWCEGGDNATYCPGPLLQDVQVAQIFPDSKTFSDKPTNGTRNATFAAFEALGDNITVAQLIQFVEENFQGEGLELEQVPIEGFNPDPAILDEISDPIYKGWVSIVNSYWTLLIRQTNESALCQPDECDSSLIPLNNTIVVPGGRYREIYYWDSYWVLQGLLKSELYDYATALVMNFMDFIRVYGFIPNGGRKYYLNRSQPPMFVQMLNLYVQETGNTTILDEALPLADIEMKWWDTNRSIEVTSPWTNNTHTVYHYNVFVNTAPRPEGYIEDYEAAMGASPALNETEREQLYIELASGAESGWDYSIRWANQRIIDLEDQLPILRTLGVVATIPVDLTSLMRGNHALLANLYQVWGNASETENSDTSNATTQAEYHQGVADALTEAALDLHWDPEKAWFYDFNMTAANRTDIFGPHGTFALWQNITPPELYGNETLGLQMASGWRYLLGHYAGIPSPATLIEAGLNWDFPNAWPPHAYTTIKAFEAIWRAIGDDTLTVTADNITVEFDEVVPGQFGLEESELPPQPEETIGNLTAQTEVAVGLPWPQALAVEWANRYMQAAFCSWYSTGGAIDGILTQLPLADLNATGDYEGGSAGVMFEKFNMTDPDAAGGGGEYEVVVGFGWTNGVVLYLAGEYGQYLAPVSCPLIPIVEIDGYPDNVNGTTSSSNGTEAGGGDGAVNGTDTSGNGTDTNGTDSGGVQSQTQARIFAGHRIPRR